MTEPIKTEMMPLTEKLRAAGPLDFSDVRRNTQLVKQALGELMVNGVDYGTIPGCGDKPGLFKPGAEKLMYLFKLGCFLEAKNVSDNPYEKTYQVLTKIVHLPTGIELGVGIGIASTEEEKYKWRRAVCDAEFDATPEERRRLKWLKDGTSTKQVRQDPANVENTIIKMAAKRSKVDGVITCTAASDIFNQGEDDIIIDVDQPRQEIKKPQPKRTPETAGGATHAAPAASGAQGGAASQENRPSPRGFNMMTAKFNGVCRGCSQETKAGTEIAYSKERGTYHPDCAPAA